MCSSCWIVIRLRTRARVLFEAVKLVLTALRDYLVLSHFAGVDRSDLD